MSRDPAALQRLQTAVTPLQQRLVAARTQVARAAAWRSAVAAVPRLSVWVGVLTAGIGLGTVVPLGLPALVVAGLAAVVHGRARHGRPALATSAEAALACDRANANADRLAAALELAAAAPTPPSPAAAPTPGFGEALAQAAIEDGEASLQRIDRTRLELPAPPAPAALWRAAACLLVVAVLPWWLPRPLGSTPEAGQVPTASLGAPSSESGRPAPTVGDRVVPAAAPQPAKEPPRREQGGRVGAPPPPPKPGVPAPAVPAASGAGQAGSDATGDSSQSGAPKAAPAASPGSGQSGGGQGSSAGGAPEPSPSQPTTKPAPPPKPRRVTRPEPQQDGKSGESAGAPSGPSRGSGRSAAVGNKRADLNRGQEREDEPEVEDEPLEDESDEQEQRGGVMPMRRGDNRPAARELSISGDGPPDQGRGGPTPPKKARGTASLVLGTRLPDAVRGQPNPGTAKTTVEQIPPRPSAADLGLATPAATGRAGTPQSRRPPNALRSLQNAYHALFAADGVPPTPSPRAPETPR